MTSINLHFPTIKAPAYITTQVRAALSHVAQSMASVNRACKADGGDEWDNPTKLLYLTINDYLNGKACVHELHSMLHHPLLKSEETINDKLIEPLHSMMVTYMAGQFDPASHAYLLSLPILSRQETVTDEEDEEDEITLRAGEEDVTLEEVIAGLSAFLQAIAGEEAPQVVKAPEPAPKAAEKPSDDVSDNLKDVGIPDFIQAIMAEMGGNTQAVNLGNGLMGFKVDRNTGTEARVDALLKKYGVDAQPHSKRGVKA